MNNFYDHKNGGFFITDVKNEIILTRLRQEYDSSTPAGNNIMMLNLLYLYYYTGNKVYINSVEQNFKLYKNDIESRGQAFASMIRAALLYKKGPVELTFSCLGDSKLEKMLHVTNLLFIPDKIVVHVDPTDQLQWINPNLLKGRTVANKNALFVCYDKRCSLPIYSFEKISTTIRDLGFYVN
jgi:uncharacterized protein YyaL (SSP411 family)